MSSAGEAAYVAHVSTPQFIGLQLGILLFGIQTSQTIAYSRLFPDDRWPLKAMVYSCWAAALCYFTGLSAQQYFANVGYHTSWTESSKPRTALSFALVFNFIPIAITLSWYAGRVLAISKNKQVTAVLALLILGCVGTNTASIAMGIRRAVHYIPGQSVSADQILRPHLWLTAFTDLSITATFAFYIRRLESGFNPMTDHLLKQLVKTAFLCSSITALFEVATAVAECFSTSVSAHLALIPILTSLYPLGMIITLNARAFQRHEVFNAKPAMENGAVVVGPHPSSPVSTTAGSPNKRSFFEKSLRSRRNSQLEVTVER